MIVCILTAAFVLRCASGGSGRDDAFRPADPAAIPAPETVKEDPSQLIAYAEYYFNRLEFTRALEYAEKVLVETSGLPETDHAYFLRGCIYESLLNYDRDIEKAAASFRMVLASAPETEFDDRAKERLEKIKKP